MLTSLSLSPESGASPLYILVPTSSFSADELVDIYNRTREDYIVPMPMSAKKMQSYVRLYDVNLDLSYVIFDQDQREIGLGMLGLRPERAWITRLGIIPERRKKGSAAFLMHGLIEAARQQGARLVQLEVIEGNLPAHSLFQKCGFVETRRFGVIRRPPGMPDEVYRPAGDVEILSREEAVACLTERSDHGASWLDESSSLLKLGQLQGIHLELEGGSGWVVYQNNPYDLTHVVFWCSGGPREAILSGLLYHLHRLHASQDTKIENIPLETDWPILHQFGYVDMFHRIEMFLRF